MIIEQRYRLGAIGRITEMHATWYAKAHGFGAVFESKVAAGLAELVERLDHARNGLWLATVEGRVVGSIAIDGQDQPDGAAHLRFFIVDESVRGTGAGRQLLRQALSFVDARGFSKTRLWTFQGLDAARHLYEADGFTLTKSWLGTQWGPEVVEQIFERGA